MAYVVNVVNCFPVVSIFFSITVMWVRCFSVLSIRGGDLYIMMMLLKDILETVLKVL
jgi:hypothetical protein